MTDLKLYSPDPIESRRIFDMWGDDACLQKLRVYKEAGQRGRYAEQVFYELALTKKASPCAAKELRRIRLFANALAAYLNEGLRSIEIPFPAVTYQKGDYEEVE